MTNPPALAKLEQYEESFTLLVEAIRLAAQIPMKDTLWTVSDIAEYLSVSVSTARKLANQPRFPRARQPGGCHPRWVAAEVVEWAKR